MFLHTWHPQPILAHLGSIDIHWYGLMLAVGAIAGLLVSRWLAKGRNIHVDHILDLFVYLLVGGLIGARLYHVTNEWTFYSAHPAEIYKIWNGGLAIHGAIIIGIIIIAVYAKVKKLSFWTLTDVLAPGLLIGQAIGRWGNYFNQELFGRPTSFPWGIPIDLAHRPTGYFDSQFFHPTFLYESLGSFVILAILLLAWRWQSQHRASLWAIPGVVTLGYFFLAALNRIGSEVFRIDRVPIIAGIRLPIITSAAIILIVLVVWFLLWRRASAHDSPPRPRTP